MPLSERIEEQIKDTPTTLDDNQLKESGIQYKNRDIRVKIQSAKRDFTQLIYFGFIVILLYFKQY